MKNSILILLLGFHSLSQASNIDCVPQRPPQFYSKMMDLRDRLIRKTANKAIFASAADKTLSQLLTAKSPSILKWLEKRSLINKSDKEIVGEWRTYHFKNFVLTKYHKQTPQAKEEINELMKKLYSQAFPQKTRKKMQAVFVQARDIAISFLSQKDSSQFKRAKSRVKAVGLYFFNDMNDSKFIRQPAEILSWTVAYEPQFNQINIGIEALKYANTQSLFAVIAHEIGHSIDPCRWQVFLKGEYPFPGVLTCLRSPRSIGAQKRDDSLLDKILQKSEELSAKEKKLLGDLKIQNFCNREIYPPVGKQKEQINEAFADWFSAEVVANSSFIKPGLRSGLCAETALMPGSSYISNHDRLQKIYWAQPKINGALKKDKNLKKHYCSGR